MVKLMTSIQGKISNNQLIMVNSRYKIMGSLYQIQKLINNSNIICRKCHNRYNKDNMNNNLLIYQSSNNNKLMILSLCYHSNTNNNMKINNNNKDNMNNNNNNSNNSNNKNRII